MSDCLCHAGKICDLHVEEVMGNLNKAVGGLQGGIVGGYLGSPSPEQAITDVSNEPLLYPTPEQIDHEILEQLSMFRQKIADLETAQSFYMECIENAIRLLKDTENKQAAIEQQFLEIISHGCCIPACSKHQGPVEIKGNG